MPAKETVRSRRTDLAGVLNCRRLTRGCDRMSKDITPLLRSWPHDGGDAVVARKIIGEDGKPKVQMRLEMGVLQMEMVGRPDGQRPFGFESILEYFQDAAGRFRFSDEEFALDHSDCAALHHESMLYYHRRICCLSIGEFEQAERDAENNLTIMDLLKEYAEDRDDWRVSERHRAFVISHRTQARALRVLKQRGRIPALRHIEEGEGEIRKVLAGYGREDLIGKTPEFQFLANLRDEIRSDASLTERELLEIKLREAVSRERYEVAAQIRDELKLLG